MKFVRRYFPIVFLLLFCILVLAVNVRINSFRYDNFDFGKFDLGNMTQMVWNTLHGRFMYLTDYFGTNLPRWAMSHVDPIMLIFVPVFALFPSPMTLVYSQLVLVIFSAFLVYLIADLELKSRTSALFLALAFLFYPAVGFLTAWTGFHGVTAVIPFFFGAFYVFELMHKRVGYKLKWLVLFWSLLVLTMMGKEQLSLYVALYGLFIVLCRSSVELSLEKIRSIGAVKFFNEYVSQIQVKTGLALFVVGIIWFCTAFFVIIPSYAHYRVNGFNTFAQTLDLDPAVVRDVSQPNYFLKRYDQFGSTYTEVIFNMVLKPEMAVKVFFGGDKLTNFNMTLGPVLYVPFLYPAIFFISAPDFAINYLTTLDGIGTSEIYNHRVSMIIPVLFISVIYAISLWSRLLSPRLQGRFKPHHFILVFSFVILAANIKTTFAYENPVYLWLNQALSKRLPDSIAKVFAKSQPEILSDPNFKVGSVIRISDLENKDRECARKIVSIIPDTATVSGPDYLGAHLSMRETYAIFPALYNSADYVIVDVFSKKIVSILDVDVSLIRDVTEDVIKNPDYSLVGACGNIFAFKRVGPHNKSQLMPLQERYKYTEKYNYQIYQNLYVVDSNFPKQVKLNTPFEGTLVYTRKGNGALTDYLLFLTLVNKKSGELFQVVNMPSFSLNQPSTWEIGHYFVETLSLVLPTSLPTGDYAVLIGMSNNIKIRSLYLTDMTVY